MSSAGESQSNLKTIIETKINQLNTEMGSLSRDEKSSKVEDDEESKILSMICNQLASSFLEHLQAKNYKKLRKTAKIIRKHLAKITDLLIDKYIETGVISHIISILEYKYFNERKLVEECSWIIANISSSTNKHVEFLISLDIVPKCISLFSSRTESFIENAIWILANIAGTSLEYRNLLLDQGIVPSLVATLDGSCFCSALLDHVSWLIINLMRGKPYPPPEKVLQINYNYILKY